MGWFEDLTGFTESPDSVRKYLALDGGMLVSHVSGRRAKTGRFELVSLGELRQRVARLRIERGRTRLSGVVGDAREMHRRAEFAGALFQVASQFNCLEMVNPRVTPEDGVSRYEHDHTQGPACAIAAGAATIYRNYFVPVAGQIGQSEACQIDGLYEVGKVLQRRLAIPREPWLMRNGYALCASEDLEHINDYCRNGTPDAMDELRSALSVGVQWDAEVTDGGEGRTVSQAFCSALPVAYNDSPMPLWEPFARLILEAAYEATLLAGVLNAAAGKSRVVLLTLVGGGAFGNAEAWILDAISRALHLAAVFDLDVRLVSFDAPSDGTRRFLQQSH